MIDLALPLKLAGWALLALAGLHVTFPRRFDWARELATLSALNRQIMQVHTLFIALTVGLMGALCALGTEALLAPSSLGRYVAVGLTIFWVMRVYCQFFVYESALWRGKTFETIMHVGFSALWVFLAALFGVLTWQQFHHP